MIRPLIDTVPITGWRLLVAIALVSALALAGRFPHAPSTSLAAHHRSLAAPTPPSNPPSSNAGESSPFAELSGDAARRSNAALPITGEANGVAVTPAAPFRFTGDETDRLRARDCLAVAALYEAGDDPPGERAVIQVVLNRARHPAFPRGICAVVFQGSERATGCQFTFTCDGALARPPAPPALARARAIAEVALAGAVDAEVGLATHYHADYVVPRWRGDLLKIARQGVHLFYRWPGERGSAAALRQTADGGGSEAAIPAIAPLSAAHAAARPDTANLPPNLPPLLPPFPHEAPDAAPNAVAAFAAAQPASAHEVPLSADAAPGSFALRALAICGRSGDCRVVGHLGGNLAFLYVRRGNGEGAYWDCARFRRPDRAQCLPEGPALARLLASG